MEQIAKPTRTERAILVLSLAGALGALLLFSWLAEEIFQGELLRFDQQVRVAIHQHASPWLTTLMKVVTKLGSAWFIISLLVVVVLLFLRMGWRRAATWIALSVAGSALLDGTLKAAFHRARPTPFFGALPLSYSFPSGHALTSFCFYGVLAGLLTARIRNRYARGLIWVAAGVLVAAIGISRIYLGVHWPTDVIAGYAAAAVWVGGLLTVDRWRRYRVSRTITF